MNLKKTLALLLCMAALVAVSVVGTLAYLTDRDSVTNTFTVGNVAITLDEADVDLDGKPIDGADRVTENDYHLIPGMTYTKDPTVAVKANSEESYVRMMVTVNYSSQLDAIFAKLDPSITLLRIFEESYDPAIWTYVGNTESPSDNPGEDTRTYEFRYYQKVKPENGDLVLEPLFTKFTVPAAFTGEDLDDLVTKDDSGNITDQFTITVNGHAIQAATFADADAAWAAFEVQYTQGE